MALLGDSFFRFYIFLFICSSVSTITSSVRATLAFTNVTDIQSLLAIKNMISEDPFGFFRSWNNSNHFCHWQGVTCGRRHQRVIVLDLSSSNLVGTLAPQIGNLTFLKKIYFENNSFQGKIPQELGRLFRLKYLYLAMNHFDGEFPTNLTLCSRIQYLDLSRNNLIGEIPAELGSLSDLSELTLSKNHFTSIIPTSLGNLSSLSHLNLSWNNLQGNIPSELGKLSKLEYLQLSINNLSGEVPDRGVFMNLTAFSIDGNKELCGGIKELKLPSCPRKLPKKERKHFPLRFIPLVIIFPVVLFLVCLSLILYRLKWFKQQNLVAASLIKEQYPKVSYQDLREATNGFSSSSLVGEGRYGSVYKGTLNSEEQIVAVKVLHLQQQGANKSFMAECEALRNIRHRNLVKIVTSCSSTDFKGNNFKALVFEFMTNGNLESWLHPISNDQQDPKNLNLVQRLNVAIDVASALDYLHHQCETSIIHCDLKPSNILLDGDLCAHVGDFGLARFLFANKDTSDQAHLSTVGVRGTIGYIPPEYGMGEAVSTQGDIYSYGILLLEMFTGKRPTDNMFLDNVSLHNYAKMALHDQVMMIIDPQILLDEEDYGRQNRRGDVRTVECLNSVIHIGVMCSTESPSERIDITDVLVGLRTAREVLLRVDIRVAPGSHANEAAVE